jgi:hypothetical protein
MGLVVVVVVLMLLLGGGGGYYGYSRYGGRGAGGTLGLVLVGIIALWLFGGMHFHH